jgi:hypothetical protein
LDLPQAHPDDAACHLAIVRLFHAAPIENENNCVFLKVNGRRRVVKELVAPAALS